MYCIEAKRCSCSGRFEAIIKTGLREAAGLFMGSIVGFELLLFPVQSFDVMHKFGGLQWWGGGCFTGG